ncbi:MAG: conserved rane protein of unknown function [Frankiales bacterium]|nr:conserved rane protein of unknown function [Frankiales bacterium]
MTLLAAAQPPAGGAALGEVFGATAAVGLVTALLLGVAVAHRTRRTTLVARFADDLGRRTGRPGWVALPTLLTTVALLTALFGMLWDISLHIGRGRDEGPLANPAHYFILVGLFLVFTAGMAAVVLPLDEDPGPAAVRITRTWKAPVGGLLVAASGFYALLGFPLDDVWHRLFGQDVTLWGPTHLMLITGAGLSLIGLLVLDQEGRAARPELVGTAGRRLHWLLSSFSLGGMLIGQSVFQAEFDFGVPQFRLVLQPMMIAGAAALALVTARLLLGRGAALAAATFFVVVRGVISLVVGPLLGEPTPSLPLYLGSALLIEALALTPLLRTPLAFGAVAGLLVGSVGSAIEAGWSYVAMPLPWTPDVWAEGLAMAVPVGVGAGLCGALLSLGLQGRLPRPSVARPVVVASLLVLAAAATNGLLATVPEDRTATVTLSPVTESADTPNPDPQSPDGAGTVDAEVVLSEDVDGPAWVQITAWQGGGLVVDRLERTGVGTYRSTEPLPVTGLWKTLLRVHDGRELTATPIYLPADEAISAPEVPAVTSTRPFTQEIEILQRERDLDVPGWTFAAASLFVLACSIALVLAIGVGVGRLSRRLVAAGDRPTTTGTTPPRTADVRA